MMKLSGQEKIEILSMVGFGDKACSQTETT